MVNFLGLLIEQKSVIRPACLLAFHASTLTLDLKKWLQHSSELDIVQLQEIIYKKYIRTQNLFLFTSSKYFRCRKIATAQNHHS